MTYVSPIDSFLSRTVKTALCFGAAAFALTACGGDSGAKTSNTASSGDISKYERAEDYATGSADAKVVVVEYASVVCGHCANWHSTVYPDFKKKYIDTGKVRYVFRSFPTAPAELADAGHMIAMCAGEDNYFKNIKLQFDRQKQIFEQAGKGQAREAYISLAKASGLSEDDFVACIQNKDVRAKYDATVQSGIDLGISGTPSFFINGDSQKVYDLESIEAVILPILGEPIPEKPAADTDAADKGTE
ncbi:MAG: thioredoxin domain-containing protein [Litorimonas sp.]